MSIFKKHIGPLELDPTERRYSIDPKSKNQELTVHGYNLFIYDHYEGVYDAHDRVPAQSFIEAQEKYWSFKNGFTGGYIGFFCPIYFIIVEDKEDEIVYVGQTNSNSNRFGDGHKATQYLNNPDFDGKKKHIYFAQIQVIYEHLVYNRLVNKHYMRYIPIEFLKYNLDEISDRCYYEKIKKLTKPKEESPALAKDFINFVESILIFMKKPIINSALKETEKKNFHNPEVKLSESGGFTVIHSDRVRESHALLKLNQDFKEKYTAWLFEESKWISI
ncbi:hypothetical protein L1N85_17080 [Paenibacillus alkaliterrae]|uniref:hypothetical protein n=1 Tax=Paenibacillus alkaliterrae TaxID=320909 RepID=UPI001F1DB4AE|nr:hypothetical protein [Paenibacillus alkaliterrae]MCF2940121.1 hypothetical protein [Paenibacillus alkaliterrae]